ncbi:MAG: sigma-70 family RNA polymerase sigma factor, partial [Pirellulaceae bacterium]|nr:sigma-70 family RNA polymerase sigma factor [Pirellulaceae bacterium]
MRNFEHAQFCGQLATDLGSRDQCHCGETDPWFTWDRPVCLSRRWVQVPRQAAVFCLAYFEELSAEEIALALEISTNAVGLALHKARAKLQEWM